jgi:hypothetical protein
MILISFSVPGSGWLRSCGKQVIPAIIPWLLQDCSGAHWTVVLVPRIGPDNWTVFADLDPVPPVLQQEILALGLASAVQLPGDFVIVGDATGELRAWDIARMAEDRLGP